MVSVTCPCVECIYNGRNNKCGVDKVKLTYRNMVTVNEGIADMWVCDKYSMSDESKRILAELGKIMERDKEK